MRSAVVSLLLSLPLWVHVQAQTDAQKPVPRVIGEVGAVDTAGGMLTIKADGAESTKLKVSEQTRFLRVPEGEKDSKKWVPIALTDISPGDRVVARGRVGAEGQPMAATMVLVMTKGDLAQKHQQERSDWQKRGVSGSVVGLDASNKEITISVRSRDGLKPLLVDVSDKTSLRRYAGDSVKFADAKTSTFDELKIGDEVRALGDKSEDGTHFTAEQILSGAFQTLAGTVVSTDAASGSMKLTNLQTKQIITVRTTPDTLLRRMPEQMATMMATRMRGAAAGGAAASGTPGMPPANPGAPSGGGAPPAHTAEGHAGGDHAYGGGDHAAGAYGGAGAAHNFDLQKMIESLPAVTVADLKPGDALILSSSKGADPTTMTAIRIVAGVEPFLAAAPRNSAGQVNLGQWNMDMSIPGQ
jgi:hypothetical protein